jgi:hypothetical protein
VGNSQWKHIFRHPEKRFWFLAIALHFFFFIYQLNQENYYLADSDEYLLVAENVWEHGSFYCGEWPPDRTDYYTKRPPLYPSLLLLLVVPFGSPILLIVLQNLLSLFNLFVLSRLLGQSWLNPDRVKTAQWNLLSLLLLLYPAQMIYANFVMTEIIMQSLILGMVWFLWQFVEKPTGKSILKYAGLLCLAILLKPVMYVFAAANVFMLAWLIWRKKRHTSMIFAALLPLMIVLGISTWNQQRTGVFHYSSIQQINLLQYNAYYSLVNSEGLDIAEQRVNQITDIADTMSHYPDRYAFIQSSTMDIMAAHFPAYLKLHTKGMFNFFIDPGRFDLYSFLGIEEREGKGKGLLYHYSESGYKGIFTYLSLQPIALLIWLLLIAALNGLKLLAAIRFGFLRNLSLEKRLLLLMFVGYLAGVTGPLGASRFAVPLFPLMLLMFALSWQQDWPKAREVLRRLSGARKKH